jgi:hypothetical protein
MSDHCAREVRGLSAGGAQERQQVVWQECDTAVRPMVRPGAVARSLPRGNRLPGTSLHTRVEVLSSVAGGVVMGYARC